MFYEGLIEQIFSALPVGLTTDIIFFFRSVTTKEGIVNYEIHCFFEPACFCIRAAFFLWLFHRDTGLVDDPFYLQKTDGLLSLSYC